MTSQDQAVLRQPPARSSPAPRQQARKQPSKTMSVSLHQSRSSSQLCTYVCTVPVPNFHEQQPTAEADRTINVSEFAATYDSSLRLMIARCNLVHIQDCDLSQR